MGQEQIHLLSLSTSSLSENCLKMSHHNLYSAFMVVIQDEVSIRAITNKYLSQSQQIRYLINKFESS